MGRVNLVAGSANGPTLIEVSEEERTSLFGRLRSGGTTGSGYPALLKHLERRSDLPAEVPDSTVAYILFTSGTTSQPKGVEITHGNLFAQMATFVRHYGLSDKTNLLNILPLHHTDGLTQGVVVAFAAGASLFRPMRFRVEKIGQLLDGIYAKRITHWVTVPAVLSLMVQLDDEFADAFESPEFEFVISTAAYLDEAVWRRFESLYQVRVVNVYGLTETVCESLYCGPDDDTRRVGSVGKPVDSEARIIDAQGRDVPQGEIGELILSGDHVMKGYLDRPEDTAEVLRDGWFYSGDLARVDEDGFYFIVGRKKNLIVTAGINVYPEEVSSVLRSLPGVLDAVTLGIDDPTWGEKVVACVEPSPGSAPTGAEISEAFLQKASPHLAPREIRIVAALPRGPAGKVLIEQVRELFATPAESAVPQSGSGPEQRLLATAARVFNLPTDALSLASDTTNTAAWTSLAHVELILALESEFDLRMSPRQVMGIRSLSDVLTILDERAEPVVPAAQPNQGVVRDGTGGA